MKSKPLAMGMAFAVLVLAAILFISNRNGDERPDDSKPSSSLENNDAAARGTQRDSRSARRGGSSGKNKEWEAKIDQVLSSDSTSNKKASQTLLGIVLDQKAPLEIRLDALEHALNLISDEDYSLVDSLLGTGKHELPEVLAQTVLDDSMNRPEAPQISTSLKLMQGSHTAVVEEARELLEFHLDAEHGDDLEKWKQAAAEYLAQQRKEDAAK